jgi:hypothetical protein
MSNIQPKGEEVIHPNKEIKVLDLLPQTKLTVHMKKQSNQQLSQPDGFFRPTIEDCGIQRRTPMKVILIARDAGRRASMPKLRTPS